LITFLGRTPKHEGSGYRRTTYDFGDGQLTDPVAFFGWVLRERLEKKVGLDRVVILGTRGSMWDHLFEQDLQLGDLHEEQRLELFEAVERKEVDQQQLDRLTPILEEEFGLSMELQIVPYCQGREEQVELLRILDDLVEEGEQIELDVTHGFRHLPMLGLMAALFLRSVRNVVVSSIWYGAYDPDTDRAPVHDLVGLLSIADWMRSLVTFEKDGDYSVFAPLLGGNRGELLAEAAFYERSSSPSRAREKLTSWLKGQERVDPSDPVASLFEPILEERLQWQRRPTRSEQERALARIYLEKRDYVRAVIYGLEGVVTADLEKGGKPSDDYVQREEARQYLRENHEAFRSLNSIRNALAHGLRPSSGHIRKVIQREEEFRNTLEVLFRKLL